MTSQSVAAIAAVVSSIAALASLFLYWRTKLASEHHESAMRAYESLQADLRQRMLRLEEARDARALEATATARAERRTKLEHVILRTALFLGRLPQTTDPSEIVRRVGWLQRIDEQLDSFAGLDGGQYDVEIRLLADALYEFRTETEATLRSGERPTTGVAGEPDKLTGLLDQAKESLARLYSATSGEPFEELMRGIPE